ncbi:hypothetical protein F5050DRAFT_1721233 [Lentinula boryana]|uniref:Uncharacterized protein n=1 Tax=Lentinula boryana TaxID=40481 RepID=A0ABQ8QT98_9AGAR|nr:hypothetical protein F5050DRAFT_1721233 [Lentinula boryana]
MASIFSRPISPPPRALSPIDGLHPLPLPLPPARSKRLSERSTPNTSSSRSSPRPLLRNTPSRGILKPTPPPSPGSPVSFSSSSSSSSSSSRGSTHTLNHRRSLQFAIPYRSPPASPTLASPPPPVPPIPAFAFALDSGASRPRHSTPPSPPPPPPPPRPTRDPRREPQDGARGGLTCTQFMSMQGSRPGSGRIRNPAQAPSTA